jgi:hypothetical protein
LVFRSRRLVQIDPDRVLRQCGKVECANPLDSGKPFEPTADLERRDLATFAPLQSRLRRTGGNFLGGGPAGRAAPWQQFHGTAEKLRQ